MAIKVAPQISAPIYLGDLSKAVQLMEGDECPQAERAFAVIKQATEGDNRRVQGLSSTVTTEWDGDKAVQKRDANTADENAMMVYLTLSEIGNVTLENGAPALPTGPGVRFAEFREQYGALPPDVARAILLAVWRENPFWDWRVRSDVECPECKARFPMSEAHLFPPEPAPNVS